MSELTQARKAYEYEQDRRTKSLAAAKPTLPPPDALAVLAHIVAALAHRLEQAEGRVAELVQTVNVLMSEEGPITEAAVAAFDAIREREIPTALKALHEQLSRDVPKLMERRIKALAGELAARPEAPDPTVLEQKLKLLLLNQQDTQEHRHGQLRAEHAAALAELRTELERERQNLRGLFEMVLSELPAPVINIPESAIHLEHRSIMEAPAVTVNVPPQQVTVEAILHEEEGYERVKEIDYRLDRNQNPLPFLIRERRQKSLLDEASKPEPEPKPEHEPEPKQD